MSSCFEHDYLNGFVAVQSGFQLTVESSSRFALLRFVIGEKISRHFLDQSKVKLKPIATCSATLARVFPRLAPVTCTCFEF